MTNIMDVYNAIEYRPTDDGLRLMLRLGHIEPDGEPVITHDVYYKCDKVTGFSQMRVDEVQACTEAREVK